MKTLATVLAAAAVAVGLNACGSSSHSRPSCQPHVTHCRQTTDGAWVPIWYFLALQSAQNTSQPSSTGRQPTSSQLKASGAPSDEDDNGGDDDAPTIKPSAPSSSPAPSEPEPEDPPVDDSDG